MKNLLTTDFDSRGLLVGQSLDPMQETIEEVISRVCYDNSPFVQQEMAPVKKTKKKESLYDKLKPLYEKQMADMSETCELTERYKKVKKTGFRSNQNIVKLS